MLAEVVERPRRASLAGAVAMLAEVVEVAEVVEAASSEVALAGV